MNITPFNSRAAEVIQKLELRPLPEEGGYYRETYRCDLPSLPAGTFGIDSQSKRQISTAIYYLVTPDSFSALHRVKSDEMFHFYGGDAAEMIQIDECGVVTKIVIGNDILNGHVPQVLVRRGVWQGLRLIEGGAFALMGTTVAPGFEFEDFEVGKRSEMLRKFPNLKVEVTMFTRADGELAHA